MKNKAAAFLLGIFLAWAGLPFGIHAAYWLGILAAFGLGWRLHP